ncbi:MAG: nucleotide-binding protein [Nitrospirae bacterium]|nr:MAG: nucleotide-binding protein [Nitrospirota bacterium]
MADVNSFDVASKVDMQEVKNALDQALKEKESELVLVSDDEYKLKSVVDILKARLIKRNVSVRAFAFGPVEPALGGTVRQVAKIQNGLSSEKAKEIARVIKDGKLKVQAQIQGEQVRVQGKSKDELQAAIALLKSQDFGIDLQYVNYR